MNSDHLCRKEIHATRTYLFPSPPNFATGLNRSIERFVYVFLFGIKDIIIWFPVPVSANRVN